MKIYDGFTLYNELDLLEIRLNELDNAVDYFVIVEAEKTHQNTPKPLYYKENADDPRFVKFKHKIINVVIPESECNQDSWHNERFAYTCIATRGFAGASDDDFTIFGPVDEIPRGTVIESIKRDPYDGVRYLHQNFYYFYLDTRYEIRGEGTTWLGPCVTKKRNLMNPDPYVVFLERQKQHPSHGDKLIPNGGWHFSFMGDAACAIDKVKSYAHSEFKDISVSRMNYLFENLKDPLGRETTTWFHSHEPLKELPQYVQDNVDKFKQYIHQLKT